MKTIYQGKRFTIRVPSTYLGWVSVILFACAIYQLIAGHYWLALDHLQAAVLFEILGTLKAEPKDPQ